ncbi:hypothetical protein KPZU09_33370 [Klebsiella pneumoniae]|uniref:Uncharacterized protein n=1 Tax=Klebsiella pneumoniae TaxID=573 RepID=A0A919HRL5_KLEPN|nr:hypothetical protein KPZU09_33370 [Klebsiella pneumoniae]
MPTQAEAAIGVLCGGGILGFGFMNIAVIPSVICVQPERSSCSRYFALMAWAGAAATSAGQGGEKPGLIHLIVSHRDSGVPGQREGYTLVYSPVGVRIKYPNQS